MLSRRLLCRRLFVIVVEAHLFEHLFELDAPLSLGDHFRIHPLVVVVVFPAFLLVVDILRFWLRSLARLLRLLWFGLSGWLRNVCGLGELLLDCRNVLLYRWRSRRASAQNEAGDVSLSQLYLLVDLAFQNVDDPVDMGTFLLKVLIAPSNLLQ